MKHALRGLVSIITAVLLANAPSVMASHEVTASAQGSNGGSDNSLQADVMNKALNKSQFKNVKASVQNGMVILTGTVDVYDQKADADRRVHRVKGVKGVENQIEVAGPDVPDQELQEKLEKVISYDRVGYGTTAFNAIGVKVQNGVVTLGGHAYGPVDADSAVAVAANMKGVKDVADEIQVDPLSPMDDQTRIAVFRSVYGFPSLNKYAMDPAKPIRISVQNGNLTLYGVVDNQADKNVAGIRANSVPGVFHVTNDLQVAGQPEKK